MDEKTIARFWSKVDRRGIDECWIWLAKRSGGYGMFSVSGSGYAGTQRTVGAHRFSYEIAYGAFDPKAFVLHRCDNPPCCNPAHLFLGDHEANMRDMFAKRREPRGARHGRTRLTDTDVLAIRRRHALGEKLIDMAEEFHVRATTLHYIVHRKTWTHI